MILLAVILILAVGFAAGFLVATRKTVVLLRRQQERRLGHSPDRPLTCPRCGSTRRTMTDCLACRWPASPS